MSRLDAAPLVDWLEPLVTDSDFPERTAEINAVLDVVRSGLDEISRLAEGTDEIGFAVGAIEGAVFGPYTGIEIDDEEVPA